MIVYLCIQPLRILAPSQTEGRGIETLAQIYLSTTGFQVNFDFVDIAGLVTEIAFTDRTAPKAYDGWCVGDELAWVVGAIANELSPTLHGLF